MTVSGEQRSYFPWSDESAIERENAQFVNQSADLRAHTEVIAAALTFLQRMLEIQSHETDEDLVALRLGVRLLNSAAAALKLGASGFYQPAITMVRDVLELAFLMDLFRRDRKGFAEWIALSKRERKCRFSPVRVRTALDELDGFKEQKRASHYDRLSSYAAVVAEGTSTMHEAAALHTPLVLVPGPIPGAPSARNGGRRAPHAARPIMTAGPRSAGPASPRPSSLLLLFPHWHCGSRPFWPRPRSPQLRMFLYSRKRLPG
jgi:hypothetical protein